MPVSLWTGSGVGVRQVSGGGYQVVASVECAAGSRQVSGRGQGGSDWGIGYVPGGHQGGIRQVFGRYQVGVRWVSGRLPVGIR